MKGWNYGYIRIPDSMYDSYDYKEFIWRLFEHFRPVDIEYNWTDRNYIIRGYSDLFEEDKKHSMNVEYLPMILKEGDTIKISFQRI